MKISQIFLLTSTFSVLSITFGLSTNETKISSQPKDIIEVSVENIAFDAINDGVTASKEKKFLNYDSDKILFKGNEETDENLPVELNTEMKSKTDKMDNILKLSMMEPVKKIPLNVILLVVDGLDISFQINNEILQTFSVRGLLKTCPASSIRFRFGEINEDCNCGELLRLNIADLVLWAQYKKGMMPGATYEPTNLDSEESEMDYKDANPEVQQIRQELLKYSEGNHPNVIQLNGNDEIYNEKDVRIKEFIKELREVFLVTLQSLNNKVGNQQRIENFIELVTLTLEELKKKSKENGYILVIRARREELSHALELFNNHVHFGSTLIVIMGTCLSEELGVVPFFARGPDVQELVNLRGPLYEIPMAVRNIIRDHESDDHDQVVFENIQPDLDFEGQVDINDEVESPRRRFARSEKVQTEAPEVKSSTTEKDAEVKSLVEKISTVKPTIASNETENKMPPRSFRDADVQPDVMQNYSPKIASCSLLIILQIVIIVKNYSLKFVAN